MRRGILPVSERGNQLRADTGSSAQIPTSDPRKEFLADHDRELISIKLAVAYSSGGNLFKESPSWWPRGDSGTVDPYVAPELSISSRFMLRHRLAKPWKMLVPPSFPTRS